MRRKCSIVLLMTALLCGAAAARTVEGTVVDSAAGTALQGAIVMLKDNAGKVVDYTVADSGGKFSINADGAGAGGYIEVSMMGYASKRLDSPFGDWYEVGLREEALVLDEVVVKAEKVRLRGDTIEYSVPTYVSQDDRSLGDILKKLPGMDVTKEGRVKYQGREIGRLYIEGRDLLGSRYNIATQNIDPQDLAAIDIYENHQPVKALEGTVESNIASINIRLKEGVKGRWTGALQGEAGYSTAAPHVPYSASAFGMYIGRNYQSINTAKTDAAGNNIIYESDPNVFIVGVDEIEFIDRYRPAQMLSVNHAQAPIDQDRTRFNTAYSVTTNHTVPIGESTVLGVGGKFEHNALTSGSEVEQTYMENDGSALSFIDRNEVGSASYYASGDLSVEVNSRKVYLKDKLRFDLRGTSAGSTVSGSENRLQNVEDRDMNLLNYFAFTKNAGKWIYSFNMFSQYTESGELMDIMAPDEGDTASQSVDSRIFYNMLKFSNRFRVAKNLSLNLYSSIPYLYRTFRTSTAGVSLSDPVFSDRMGNDVMLQYLKPREYAALSFTAGRLRMNLGVEAWYQYLDYRLEERLHDHLWAVNPSLSVKYDFGPRLSGYLLGSYSRSSVDEQRIYDGLILQNFRYMSLGRTELTQNPQWNVAGSLDFRDPISGWYLKMNGRYNASRSFQYTRYFVDEYILSWQSDEVTDYSLVSADAVLSKAFHGFSGKIDLSGGFAMSSSNINQEGTVIPYRSYTYTAGLKFIGDIARWMKVDYSGGWSLSRYSSSGGQDEGDSHGLNQKLTLSFFPHRSLSIDVTAEHYLDKYAEDNLVQMCLLDASLYWFVSRKFQIFLHARNLLDTRDYTYTMLSPLNVTRYSYRLRPLNVLIGFEVKF